MFHLLTQSPVESGNKLLLKWFYSILIQQDSIYYFSDMKGCIKHQLIEGLFAESNE